MSKGKRSTAAGQSKASSAKGKASRARSATTSQNGKDDTSPNAKPEKKPAGSASKKRQRSSSGGGGGGGGGGTAKDAGAGRSGSGNGGGSSGGEETPSEPLWMQQRWVQVGKTDAEANVPVVPSPVTDAEFDEMVKSCVRNDAMEKVKTKRAMLAKRLQVCWFDVFFLCRYENGHGYSSFSFDFVFSSVLWLSRCGRQDLVIT